MVIETENPKLPKPVWWAVLAVAVVVGLGGGFLYFFPEVIRPRWPWKLTPFNTRFLGAVYLAELGVALVALIYDRWSPGRALLYQGLPFAVVITIASFLYFDSFDFGRRTTWLWFILYAGPLPLAFWFLSRYWNKSPGHALVAPGALPTLLVVQAGVFGIYFLMLWIAPAAATGFWPWPIDGLHARMYSAIALALAIGAYVVYSGGTRLEYFALGLTQVTFGILAIAGVVIVDAAINRIVWSAPGTWAWIAVLVYLAGVGALMVRASLQLPASDRVAV